MKMSSRLGSRPTLNQPRSMPNSQNPLDAHRHAEQAEAQIEGTGGRGERIHVGASPGLRDIIAG